MESLRTGEIEWISTPTAGLDISACSNCYVELFASGCSIYLVKYKIYTPGPLLVTWINFNSSMNK